MKNYLRFVAMTLSLLSLSESAAIAEEQATDPLAELSFPLEMLVHQRNEIGLNAEQFAYVKQNLETAKPYYESKERKLKAVTQSLGQIFGESMINEEAALEHLDEIMKLEREMKRLQLSLMIRLHNRLSPEQRTKVRELRKTFPEFRAKRVALEERLKAKLQEVQETVEGRAQAGDPPFDVVEIMTQFPIFMEAGSVVEAEGTLDKAREALGLK